MQTMTWPNTRYNWRRLKLLLAEGVLIGMAGCEDRDLECRFNALETAKAIQQYRDVYYPSS